jgi:predicted RNase H-like nuclease
MSRKVFEVYPHPSMVVLFNLNKILRYKAKPKRSLEFRIKEFDRYKSLLKGLKNPVLKIKDKRINADLGKMTITELKGYEDMLDAVFCAYIAYYYWVNPDRCAVLGNMKDGYIMTPIFDHMKGNQSIL